MSLGQVKGSYLFLLHWLMKQHGLFFFLLNLILADGLCTDVLMMHQIRDYRMEHEGERIEIESHNELFAIFCFILVD